MGHIKLPVAVHLILINQNKILLSRRFNTGFQDGNYSLVAGHINGNESIMQAMIRETKEEANIIIFDKALDIVQVMHRKTDVEERIDYFLYTNEWDGKINNNEPNKCDDLRWFPCNQMPDNMVGYVNYALNCYSKKIKFTNFGW